MKATKTKTNKSFCCNSPIKIIVFIYRFLFLIFAKVWWELSISSFTIHWVKYSMSRYWKKKKKWFSLPLNIGSRRMYMKNQFHKTKKNKNNQYIYIYILICSVLGYYVFSLGTCSFFVCKIFFFYIKNEQILIKIYYLN